MKKKADKDKKIRSQCCLAEVEEDYFEEDGHVTYFCKKCGEVCEIEFI